MTAVDTTASDTSFVDTLHEAIDRYRELVGVEAQYLTCSHHTRRWLLNTYPKLVQTRLRPKQHPYQEICGLLLRAERKCPQGELVIS